MSRGSFLMLYKRLFTVGLVAASLSSTAAARGPRVQPFVGYWQGLTISADPTNFPVVAIVAAGGGVVTPLGRMTMVSPHTTDVTTGETIGEQNFVAANGDTVSAHCAGFPQPQADGTVFGPLACAFTGGTGRLSGATGHYTFLLYAQPRTDGGPGYATTALIVGTIATR
jgi:hypothetical protein